MYRSLLISGLLLACGLFPQIARAQFADTYLGKTRQQWQAQLHSKQPRERRTAAFALGTMGSQASSNLPSLLQLLKSDDDARVREAAAFAIGSICKSGAIIDTMKFNPTLEAKLAGDPKALVRRSCAYALGCQGEQAENSLQALDKALNDESLAVRQNAAWALGQIGSAAVLSLRKAMRDNTDAAIIRDAAGGLLNAGPDALPAVQDLVDRCNHPNVEARKAVLSTLVALLNPENRDYAAGPLQRAFRDENYEVKLQAAFALSRIGGEPSVRAVPVLRDCLKEEKDEDLRRQAAAAFRSMGEHAITALPDLRRIALDKQEDLQLRFNAIVSMGGLGKTAGSQAVPTLMESLTDLQEDNELRQRAGESLTNIGVNEATERTIPRLIKMIENPKDHLRVRWKAIWALKMHGREKLVNYKAMAKALNNILAQEKIMAENKMLRYDSAIMLGVLERDKVNKLVLDNLLDFLKDDTIQIYKGTRVGINTTVGEGSKPGKTDVGTLSSDDGRIQAIIALDFIGANRVKSRQDVIRALQAILSTDGTKDANLRAKTKQLLNKLGL